MQLNHFTQPILVLPLLWGLSLLSSCGLIHIDGTLQGLFGYYNQTLEEAKVRLIHVDAAGYEQAGEEDSSVVYVMHGQALREVVAKHSKAIVNLWSPYCPSEYCYSLSFLQDYCTENGISLFIVADYYDTPAMDRSYELENPIIGIDVKHYRTNLTKKYKAKFLSDLLNTPSSPDQAEQRNHRRILYFEEGQFVKFCRDIGELGPAWSEWGMR